MAERKVEKAATENSFQSVARLWMAHLPAAELLVVHIVLHDRAAAGVAVFSAQPREDPLGRVTLLAWPLIFLWI